MKRSATTPLLGLIRGQAFILGNYVDADAVIPVRYCTRPTPEILTRNCLTMLDPDFPLKARAGLILVVGKNFGGGSANENSVRALLLNGVRAVVASNFGLLFRRNAINMGLPIMQCPRLVDRIENGDHLELDVERQRCADADKGITEEAERFSDIEVGIIRAGGLVNWIKSSKELPK